MSPEKRESNQRARFQWYFIGASGALIALFTGYKWGAYAHRAQISEIATLQKTTDNLNQENNRLTRQLNVLGVELEVQRLAAQNAQDTIIEGLARENQLQEQLAFYQKVMAPELDQQGFVIDAFEVQATQSINTFRFELVLMQQDKIKHTLKGNISVTVHGAQNGSPEALPLLTLMPENTDPLTFGFKYFQVLHGQFTLPEGFVPERIQVNSEVFQFKKKRGDLEKVFEWNLQSAPVAERAGVSGEDNT